MSLNGVFLAIVSMNAIGFALLNAIGFAALLWFSEGNRKANHVLALLILLLALRIGPHALGLLDVHNGNPGLVFLPLDFAFAFGPLLWIYVAQLTHMALHFIPAALKFAYLISCSLLSPTTQAAWYAGPHSAIVSPASGILVPASAAYYLAKSWRLAARYRAWLDETSANREEARLIGLQAILIAYGIALALLILPILFTLFAPPGQYEVRAPISLVLILLTYALGLLGWRYAKVEYPPYRPVAEGEIQNEPKANGRSYREQASGWQWNVAQSGWWRDETLNLAQLANRLGASPRTVSRVLRNGSGENFRSFIGRIRVEAVCTEFETAPETISILDIALSCGFNSKASFNRVFLHHKGVSPSTYRAQISVQRLKNSQSTSQADFEATPVTS